MKKIAVILYGQPGSGKGTQAEFIAREFGLIHFDTGRYCEALVHDPQKQKNPVIRKERKLFDAGMLMTPSFVFQAVRDRIRQIERARWGVVLSGSPRTLYEAERLLPFLEKSYGKQNIFIFTLRVPPRVSIQRNLNRLICRACKAPLLSAYYPSKKPKYCPLCGGALYRRTLDDASVIKVRLKEYTERTEPIFSFLKKRGYAVRVVNATDVPYRVFQKIKSKL